jgi:arylsulfatase A-like enzyme
MSLQFVGSNSSAFGLTSNIHRKPLIAHGTGGKTACGARDSNWMMLAMRNLHKSFMLAVLLLGQIPTIRQSAFAANPAAAGQPNIVLFIADDLGYGELGCQGNPEIPTPNIDALAASGVRCTQAYVTAPNCSPSRAGLFTGRIPMRFGYEFNPIGARNEDAGIGLPPAEVTLAECLHDAGYTTGLIGKWHLGGTADFHPQRHGFDEFFGFMHEGHYFAPPPWTGTTLMLRKRGLPTSAAAGGDDSAPKRYRVSESLFYSSHMGHNEPDYDANNPIIRGGQPMVEEEYLTDAFAREAVSFIDRYQRTPFFLCVTFNAVHSPLQAKSTTLSRFENIEDIHRRIFAAMLSDLDQAIGRVMESLEQNEIREHTLVIFLSDNGGPTKELTSSNLPLRDGKSSMYEGGLRVPFIVNWPDVLPSGEVCTEIISSMDIFPTAVLAAGGSVPDQVEGVNMLPVLQDRSAKSEHQRLFWRQGGRAALRNSAWKIVSPNRKSNVRNWELYNIDSDIGESRDLAEEYPQKLDELKKQWEALDSEMARPQEPWITARQR